MKRDVDGPFSGTTNMRPEITMSRLDGISLLEKVFENFEPRREEAWNTASSLKNFVLPHVKPIAFLLAYGEVAIGIALVLGILVRPASVCGVIYMLTLLFSANYPGPHAAFWQYFGASLEHLVLALCFAAFASTNPQEILSICTYLQRPRPV